jgi:hypothetical protein
VTVKSWTRPGGAPHVFTAPPGRVHDFTVTASPYLDGTFDELYSRHRGRFTMALCEPNRGCPLSCTFCDWSLTKRVVEFPIERVEAELEWVARHDFRHMMLADANFGIRPRDTSIARYLAGLVVAGIVGVAAALRTELIAEYQLTRLTAFLDAGDPSLAQGPVFQTRQSVIAIGSGQFGGKGLFQGTQTSLSYVPENHTDFVFTVIGEEFGFVGAMLVLGLFLVLIWRGLRIAVIAKDLFGTLLASGGARIYTLTSIDAAARAATRDALIALGTIAFGAFVLAALGSPAGAAPVRCLSPCILRDVPPRADRLPRRRARRRGSPVLTPRPPLHLVERGCPGGEDEAPARC